MLGIVAAAVLFSVPHIVMTRHKMPGQKPLLQVLWLADNQISCLAGLCQLTSLQELNLARNLIEVVSDQLECNTALQMLNLADNRLGSFKQVWHQLWLAIMLSPLLISWLLAS